MSNFFKKVFDVEYGIFCFKKLMRNLFGHQFFRILSNRSCECGIFELENSASSPKNEENPAIFHTSGLIIKWTFEDQNTDFANIYSYLLYSAIQFLLDYLLTLRYGTRLYLLCLLPKLPNYQPKHV